MSSTGSLRLHHDSSQTLIIPADRNAKREKIPVIGVFKLSLEVSRLFSPQSGFAVGWRPRFVARVAFEKQMDDSMAPSPSRSRTSKASGADGTATERALAEKARPRARHTTVKLAGAAPAAGRAGRTSGCRTGLSCAGVGRVPAGPGKEFSTVPGYPSAQAPGERTRENVRHGRATVGAGSTRGCPLVPCRRCGSIALAPLVSL